MGYVETDIRKVPLDEVAAKFATLTMSGVGINKSVQLLSEEFQYNFTRTQVARLEKKDVYIRVVKEYYDSIVKKAVMDLKRGTSNLVPKIISAIEKALDEGNIGAITHALKILGIEQPEAEGAKQAQTIQVIMPGGVKKELKDVN